MATLLPRSFYLDDDVVNISKRLLGKCIVTELDGIRTAGMIVEAEAYRAPEDRGSHAYRWKRTRKNEQMYLEGGAAYVYICYGIHRMFNVVTNTKDIPHAVLIRGVEPLEGIGHMLRRRGMERKARNLTAGPGLLCKALGIRMEHGGALLYDPASPVRIEDRGITVGAGEIKAGKRVGFSIDGKWAKIPWRFRISGNPWTSPAK